MAYSEFTRAVYRVVARIPRGRVATYGQVALLAGRPRCPRQVGQALHGAHGLPCHRVVNRDGRPAPVWPEQRFLLEAEGVPLGPDGTVDLNRYQWRPETPLTGSSPEAAGAADGPAVQPPRPRRTARGKTPTGRQ